MMLKIAMTLSLTVLLAACSSNGKRRMAGELVEDVLKAQKRSVKMASKRCTASTAKGQKARNCARTPSQKLAAK